MTSDNPHEFRDDGRVERLMGVLDTRVVRLRPGVRGAVMEEIERLRIPAWVRTWRWLAAPRVSPLAVGSMLAAAALLLMLRAPERTPQDATPAATPVAATQPAAVPVRLVFVAPHAASVAVTGDFAHWNPSGIPLTKAGDDGIWSVDLELPPGLHHYVFIVNGTEWRPDPNAASQEDDGFGQKNSLLLVTSRRSS